MPGEKCASLRFRSPLYYWLNLHRLPRGVIVIGGVNFNQPVSIQDHLAAIKLALRGGAFFGLGPLSPWQQLNQEFVALQLSLASVGGLRSAATSSSLRCHGLNFIPVGLSNQEWLTPDSTLGMLIAQARAAIEEHLKEGLIDIQPVIVLAILLDALNGNAPFSNLK